MILCTAIGLQFRRSFHSRCLSAAGARSIAWLERLCVWSILLMYACTPELLAMTFFCFLWSNNRTKTGVCFFSLFSSITSTDKNCSQTKKKKKCHASALPSPVAGSSYLISFKVKNKDSWTTNAIDPTVSVEQTERASSRIARERGPFSLSRSWYRTLTDVRTPIVRSITHKQTWLNMNSDVDCMRNSSHQV